MRMQLETGIHDADSTKEDVLACYPGHFVRRLDLSSLQGYKSSIDSKVLIEVTQLLCDLDANEEVPFLNTRKWLAEAYHTVAEFEKLQNVFGDENVGPPPVTNLVHLDLADCFFVGEISFLAVIRCSPSLKYLNISGCIQLTDKILSHIGTACMNLQTLIIGPFYGGFEALEAATRGSAKTLEAFHVSAKSDQGGTFTSNFPNLRSLELEGIQIPDDNFELLLRVSGRSLRELYLRHNHTLNQSLAKIGLLCSHLQTLHLPSMSIPSGTLRSLSEGGSQTLESLNLSYCTSLTDDDLLLLANSVGNLRYLNLDRCREISDISMIRLLPKCPLLETLLLRATSISYPSLAALASSPCASTLSRLSLRDCHELSPRSINRFVSSGKLINLKRFDLSGLPIDDDDLRVIVERLPRVEKVHIRTCLLVTEEFANHFDGKNADGKRIVFIDTFIEPPFGGE